MRKHSLIAVVAAVSLVGCGATKTVTLTSFRPTTAPSLGGMGGITSAVAACFRAAGARVRGPQAAGRGLAVYVTTRDGENMGFVKAPDASTIKAIGKVFTQAGGHITVLKQDPTAFVFYNGSLTKKDSDLLRKCSAR